MRLLLKLCSEIDSRYDNEYHYNLQGFIYNLIKTNKEYSYLHDKKGYKFFCFSNLFPYSEMIYKNDIRNLIISSPDISFIDTLSSSINLLPNHIVKIGKMRFKLIDVEKIKVIVPNAEPFSLITGTPIIIRIPRRKFLENKSNFTKEYSYIYWKKDIPIEFFMNQLEDTLIKKYNEYCKYKKDLRPLSELVHLFERFKFKKQVSTQIKMKNFSYKIIGTLWEFNFEGWGNNNMIEFALDAGLGERNSLGFGFMNILNNSRNRSF